MGLFVLRPVPGDRIDERLIVCLSLACRHGRGLAMGLGYELGGADVRHPDLDGAKALTAQPLSVLSYTFTGGSHTAMLHVTSHPCDQPRSCQPVGLRGSPGDLPHIIGSVSRRLVGPACEQRARHGA